LEHLLPASEAAPAALPLWLLAEGQRVAWEAARAPEQRRWLRAQAFVAERGRVVTLPGTDGGVSGAVMGLGTVTTDMLSWWDFAGLPDKLPAGDFQLATAIGAAAGTQLALGWLHGSYRMNQFRAARQNAPLARLVVPNDVAVDFVRAAHDAATLARDLINMPANALGPAELAAAVHRVVLATGGTVRECRGGDLQREYPLIAAVGQGSERAPRLLDARWPRAGAPRVTLIGKGVCFDTGGLDIKPSSGMLLMKKDMGGAACALALAQLLRKMNAPIELRLLIPAVENSVGGNAFRPGDVWRSRQGLTVEIGNTDAEGRLVLADALADADSEQPDLLMDFATLTGAARTALGPELPAIFSNDRALLSELQQLGELHSDPLWPLPLWANYDDELGSRIADLNNVSSTAFAGSIIGALFLKRFVTATPRWLHADIYAWNSKDRPGRPVGAEAQGIRAAYALIRQRFG
jgi:leucyl aminopeptidase